MKKQIFFLVSSMAFFGFSLAHAQSTDPRLMGLQQDVMALQQKVGALSLELEAMRTQNDNLREQLSRSTQGSVTPVMLKTQLDALRCEYDTRADRDKQDILNQISKQIDKLGATLNAAPAKAFKEEKPVFVDDYPKEGIAYTVKPGDTLSKIAQENASSIRDIQNANKIADPKALKVGQQLFVPQRG